MGNSSIIALTAEMRSVGSSADVRSMWRNPIISRVMIEHRYQRVNGFLPVYFIHHSPRKLHKNPPTKKEKVPTILFVRLKGHFTLPNFLQHEKHSDRRLDWHGLTFPWYRLDRHRPPSDLSQRLRRATLWRHHTQYNVNDVTRVETWKTYRKKRRVPRNSTIEYIRGPPSASRRLPVRETAATSSLPAWEGLPSLALVLGLENNPA